MGGKPRVFTRENLLKLKPEFYFDVNEVIVNLPIEHRYFSSWLFENYTPFYMSIDDLARQANVFSDKDIQERKS